MLNNQLIMKETKNANSKLAKIIKFFKYSILAFFILVVLVIIIFTTFLCFFEIDGLGEYRDGNVKKLSLTQRLERIKKLYYQGRFIDAGNDSGIDLRRSQSLLIKMVRDLNSKDNIIDYEYRKSKEAEKEEEEDDDDDDEDEDENEDENENEEDNNQNTYEEKFKEYKKQREKRIKTNIENVYNNLKLGYEINIFVISAKTMKDTYKTNEVHPLYFLTSLNKFLPKKLQIPTKIRKKVQRIRIFQKHDPIPNIYDYAIKINKHSYPDSDSD